MQHHHPCGPEVIHGGSCRSTCLLPICTSPLSSAPVRTCFCSSISTPVHSFIQISHLSKTQHKTSNVKCVFKIRCSKNQRDLQKMMAIEGVVMSEARSQMVESSFGEQSDDGVFVDANPACTCIEELLRVGFR
eukprot:TRINITY_DN808_c0_g1_i1.p2 TRINITY_DN808_c0_g1~~TRINITY_DN808_c0_g1_i1.p2  ORF type:complete len:133 (-),score=2.21 TRINITY_DN808_c0_g1_i1:804-1202(-)